MARQAETCIVMRDRAFGGVVDGLLPHLQSALGVVVILAPAWALSEDRRAFPWRLAAGGIGLQFLVALLLLKVPGARDLLFGLNGVVTALTDASRAGTGFVFGYVGGAPPPFAVGNAAGLTSLAFTILRLVMVIAALSALLWHWGVLRLVVRAMAFLLRKTLGIGGAVGLGAAAMVFLGNIAGVGRDGERAVGLHDRYLTLT